MEKWIKEYQCSGCIRSCEETIKGNNIGTGCGCQEHQAGTLTVYGNLFLGLPKGFNRLGTYKEFRPHIFETFESFEKQFGYEKFNVPVWKFKNEHSHTLVRGLSPRLCQPFIHIILEDCIDKIECLELFQDDIDKMD